jgi:hypothetical protein
MRASSPYAPEETTDGDIEGAGDDVEPSGADALVPSRFWIC